MSIKRTFDWRFLVALMAMLMVAYLVFIGYSSTVEVQRKGDRIDRLVTALKDQRTTADLAQRSAAEQRASLLANQRRLLVQLARVNRKQDALLTYLQANGIVVPADLSTGTRSPSSASTQTAPRARQSGSRPRATVKPRSTPTPAPKPRSRPKPSPQDPPGDQPKTGICALGICLP